MSEGMKETLGGLRQFMFENVYLSDHAVSEKKKVHGLITNLFDYFRDNPEKMDGEFKKLMENGEDKERVACDYVACMTDRYAITLYKKLFIPSSWSIY